MASKPLAVGDRVALTANFLRSLCLGRDHAKLRGTITEINDGWLARVAWEGAEARTYNVANLCRERSVAFIE